MNNLKETVDDIDKALEFENQDQALKHQLEKRKETIIKNEPINK